MAVYLGLGLSWVMTEASNLLRSGVSARATLPDPVTCMIPFDLAFFLLAGLRTLFTLPVELRANWLFQMTAGEQPPAVESATRKFLIFTAILPLGTLAFPVYWQAWGAKNALIHTWVYALESWLVLEILMGQFHKIPFTCSWLPGKANLKVRLGAYFILFGFCSSLAGVFETNVLRAPSWNSVMVMTGVLTVALAWFRWRRRQHRQEPWAITFEERPELTVDGLNLVR